MIALMAVSMAQAAPPDTPLNAYLQCVDAKAQAMAMSAANADAIATRALRSCERLLSAAADHVVAQANADPAMTGAVAANGPPPRAEALQQLTDAARQLAVAGVNETRAKTRGE